MIVRSIWPLLLASVAVVTGIPNPYPYAYSMPPFPLPYQMQSAYPVRRQYQRSGGIASPAQPFQKNEKAPVVYAPYPGEIVLKLIQNWDTELLDMTSPQFQILEGNLRSAVQAVMGPMTQVTNIYFREGYVPGNPPSRPKTVAHMMVNGGSDAASILERSVTPDGSLGDGLKVYKDSFNAY